MYFSRLPSIVAAGSILALVIYGYILFRQPPKSAPDTMASILTAANALKPVKLEAEQRLEAMRQCIVAFDTQEEGGIQHFGKPEDIKSMLAQFASGSCKCMIKQLERRSNTFEFVLAMSMQFAFTQRSDYASYSSGYPKKRERILPYATAIGLTTKQFDAFSISAEKAIMVAGDHCMDTNGN